MKKIIIGICVIMLGLNPVLALDERFNETNLKNKRHYAIANPFAESLVEHGIKRVLRKETGADFRVKFSAYTLSSLKKGIFKSIELSGNNLVMEEVPIPYVHLKSLTDYNYVDYKTKPPIFKSDMEFAYEMMLSEDTINAALAKKEYNQVLDNINNIAYPLFVLKNVRTKIMNNRLYVILTYNLPINPKEKDKTFVASSLFKVVDSKIIATDVKLDSVYKKISVHKVANLINLVNPLEFMLSLLNSKKCKGNVENLYFNDNKILVSGRIYVKGVEKE